MLQIKKKSVLLIKKLELCSKICSRSMNKFRDLGKSTGTNRAIVFISNNLKTIEDIIKKSLKYYEISLDYKVISIGVYNMKDFNLTGKQIIVTTKNFVYINNLKYLNQKFVVVDLPNKKYFNNSTFYIDLIVKNTTSLISNTVKEV